MWHTPLGERYLSGKEPERWAYAYGFKHLLRSVKDGADVPRLTKVEAFDGASRRDRLVGVTVAAAHLLNRQRKAKPLTAFCDAAAAVPVLYLKEVVDEEMRRGESWHREMILHSAWPMGLRFRNEEVQYDDESAWSDLIEKLAARVAWRTTPDQDPKLKAIADPLFEVHPTLTQHQIDAAYRQVERVSDEDVSG